MNKVTMLSGFTLALALLLPLSARAQSVFINEIHYDNDGTDTGEFVEVAGPAGTDLTGWTVVLYNGSNGTAYNTAELSGTIPSLCTVGSTPFGVVVIDYPTNGIQNGPDAIALVDAGSSVVQFLSYEGTFTAADGPAAGMTSTDIGVSESSSTPVGQSLQYTSGGWTGPTTDTKGACNTDQPLPVELADFTAQVRGDAVLLRWATASETNNAGFEVQRLAGTAFERVGFVEGHGTTNEAQRYTYEVAGLAPGRHVFRLKQIDFDGTFAFSPEVEVTVEVPGLYRLSDVYPNPFNPQASFTLAVAEAQPVTVALYDLLGRQVALLYQGRMEADTEHRFTLDGTHLTSGLYLLQVRGRTFNTTRTVSLVK